MSACRCLNCIMPPHILRRLLENKNSKIRQSALNTLLATSRLRGERSVRAALFATVAPTNGRRTIFDAKHKNDLTKAVMARSEGGKPVRDGTVNRAYDGFGTTNDFYKKVFNRNSIDDRGMRLNGYVHRGVDFNNAFWDGQGMVFGDGDGEMFTDFTLSLDVIGHELAHGVTEFTANLEYHNESGALNESMSDVFGSLVKQWSLKQTAAKADWLIGAAVTTPTLKMDALRSLKAPGTAFDNDIMGKDPQPDHMDNFAKLPDTEEGDNGGVHINSGIPNKAFFLAATVIGGNAWEAAGHIWYEALRGSNPKTGFQEFADTTFAQADKLFGAGSAQQQAVLSAWKEVGIKISNVPVGAIVRRTPGASGDNLAALTKQIENLSGQVKALSREIASLKAGKGKK
jgi:Zn-dependent metalloprotease